MKRSLLTSPIIDKIIPYGNTIVKFGLIIAIVSLTISTILLISYGKGPVEANATDYGVFVWYSLLGSMWIIIYSPLYLFGIVVFNKVLGRSQAYPLKGHFILLLIAIGIAALFVLISYLFK